MGESLYQKWLDEEVEDVQGAFLLWGLGGMLSEFESWLRRNGYVKEA